jgi:hypothetical protein
VNGLISSARWAMAFLAALHAFPAPAAAMANARSAGMAGAYTAIADDADAMLWNPALLGKAGNRDRASLTLLPNLSLGLGNNVLSFGELARLLDTRSVSAENVESVIENLPGTGWRLILDSGTTLAYALPGSRTGGFLHAVADTKGFDIPRDVIAMAFKGNASVPNVRIDNLKGATATAVAALGSSFAFPVGDEGAIGMNLRYLRGLGYARVSEASGSLLSLSDTGAYAADARLETEVATHGNGIAADFGAAGVLGDRLRWGAVLGNLGVMTWSRVDIVAYTLKVEPFTIVDASGSVADFGEVTRNALQESRRQEGPREIWLPPYARLSGAFRPWSPLTLTGEFQVGFGEGYGVSTIPELKLGSELRALDWLPIRGGFALGGDRGLLLATGLGLDLPGFRLDLAMGAMNGFGSHARGAYYSVSNTLRF